jgi:hypothetical protein
MDRMVFGRLSFTNTKLLLHCRIVKQIVYNSTILKKIIDRFSTFSILQAA